MLWTLQSYISRELGKTFALTSVGLVAVIGLGGGVMNMIELEGVSALQMLKLMALILPVAGTLTLPIAALYSATVTYGRLSADNEFNACRSSGINIHVLFLPTVVISMVSAVFCFFFINFVIPSMVRNLDQFLEVDLPRLIQQRLATTNQFGIRDKVVIYADNTTLETSASGEPLLRLNGVAFTEMDEGAWMRFGTARSVVISFERENDKPAMNADMVGIRLYDASNGVFGESAHQSLGGTIPRNLPVKIKWLTLGGLLEYRKTPESFPGIGSELDKLRGGIARALMFNDVAKRFPETGEITIRDDERTLTITSRLCRLDKLDKERRPRFVEDVVITETRADGIVRTVRADAANFDVRRGQALADTVIDVEANGRVTIDDPRAGGSLLRRDREKFDPVRLPEAIIQQAESHTAEELLDPAGKPLRLSEWVDERREKIIQGVGGVAREITGELHARFAFSISVFVLVILGAALGIAFRGAHVLVAFGISFVPSVLLISLIIMGKQLIEKPGMTLPGIGVIWAGIALVALVDVFVLTRVVRR